MRKIVVMQRGWVAVGLVENFGHLGQYRKIREASIIRRWGTSKGLGEIAENGPTKSTVLDRCPDITCHELTVVFEMECIDANWR